MLVMVIICYHDILDKECTYILLFVLVIILEFVHRQYYIKRYNIQIIKEKNLT